MCLMSLLLYVQTPESRGSVLLGWPALSGLVYAYTMHSLWISAPDCARAIIVHNPDHPLTSSCPCSDNLDARLTTFEHSKTMTAS